MKDLIARLETAARGAKELDRLIARAVGWHRVAPRHGGGKYGGWIAPQDFLGVMSDGSPKLDGQHGTEIHRDPPAFTMSIDDAVTLLPNGWKWDATTERHASFPDHAAHATAMNKDWPDPAACGGDIAEDGHAPTVALALCIACLKGRSSAPLSCTQEIRP